MQLLRLVVMLGHAPLCFPYTVNQPASTPLRCCAQCAGGCTRSFCTTACWEGMIPSTAPPAWPCHNGLPCCGMLVWPPPNAMDDGGTGWPQRERS